MWHSYRQTELNSLYPEWQNLVLRATVGTSAGFLSHADHCFRWLSAAWLTERGFFWTVCKILSCSDSGLSEWSVASGQHTRTEHQTQGCVWSGGVVWRKAQGLGSGKGKGSEKTWWMAIFLQTGWGLRDGLQPFQLLGPDMTSSSQLVWQVHIFSSRSTRFFIPHSPWYSMPSITAAEPTHPALLLGMPLHGWQKWGTEGW